MLHRENIKSNNYHAYLVDYSNITKPPQKIIKYNETMEYYKACRIRHMDPIIQKDIDSTQSYKYYYEWDPYNGQICGIDSDGPLAFHPDTLIKYFYTNRLNDLWVPPSHEYEGYYDMAVGSGSDICVNGICPEKYLFRLPIHDCYLRQDHNFSLVTMGPRLSDNDIREIVKMTEYDSDYYFNNYGSSRPDLCLMKKLYDEAINNEYGDADDGFKKNIDAVEKLKMM